MRHPLPRGGLIRKLWIGESERYRDHLLRLDADSRRNRFAGAVSDQFVRDYAELSFGIVFAGELLHALVVGEARHVQELEATVARGEQRALEQHGTDAVALPWFLDRERHLGFTRHGRSDLPQLRRAAKRLVDEEAMNKRVDAE